MFRTKASNGAVLTDCKGIVEYTFDSAKSVFLHEDDVRVFREKQGFYFERMDDILCCIFKGNEKGYELIEKTDQFKKFVFYVLNDPSLRRSLPLRDVLKLCELPELEVWEMSFIDKELNESSILVTDCDYEKDIHMIMSK
jgi:hypothetical protein